MAAEKAIDESDLIANKNTERETQHSRPHDQSFIQPGEFVSREGKRQRDDRRDQHHSCDRANPEDQKIKNSPLRIVNRTEYEQRHRGGTRQSVHQADEERAERVEQAEPC